MGVDSLVVLGRKRGVVDLLHGARSGRRRATLVQLLHGVGSRILDFDAVGAVAAEAGGAALRVHLDRAEAAASVASLLARVAADAGRARGSITICVPDTETGREIDVLLPRVWPVSPQVKGALRAMPGVVLVEEL
jgi:hypothetical protein